MNKVEFQFRQEFFEIIKEIKQLFLQKYFLEVSAQINDVFNRFYKENFQGF